MYVDPQEQVPLYILHAGWGFLLFKLKSVLIFLVVHFTTIWHSTSMKDLSFRMKCLDSLSFSGQKGNSTKINGEGSSKKKEGIRGRSSSSSVGFGLTKFVMTDFTNFSGKPAVMNFFWMIGISSSTLLDIRFAL